MFRLGPDEGAALLAALALGKDVLRAQKRSAERSGAEPEPEPKSEGDDCSVEPMRPKVSNADALALMVETMLAADHTRDISRHERTLVVVHLDPDKAHLHEGPNISRETTAKRMSCDACVCGAELVHRRIGLFHAFRAFLEPNHVALVAHDAPHDEARVARTRRDPFRIAGLLAQGQRLFQIRRGLICGALLKVTLREVAIRNREIAIARNT